MGLQLRSVQSINPSLTLRIFGSHDTGDQSVYVAMPAADDLPSAKELARACWACSSPNRDVFCDLSNLAVAAAMIHFLGFQHAPRSSLAIDFDIADPDIRAIHSSDYNEAWPDLLQIIAPLSPNSRIFDSGEPDVA